MRNLFYLEYHLRIYLLITNCNAMPPQGCPGNGMSFTLKDLLLRMRKLCSSFPESSCELKFETSRPLDIPIGCVWIGT